MDLDTPISVPPAFLETHYCQHHLMHALDVDEPTFWALYVSGRIPRGVSLMPILHVPLIVWPKHVLDEWHQSGCPAEPGAIELQSQVLHSLIEACVAEGVTFPTCPPVLREELN